MDTRFGRPRNATKVVWCAGNDDDFLLRLLVGRCATIPLPCGRGKGGGERMMAAILRWTTSVHPIDDACRTQFLSAGAHFATSRNIFAMLFILGGGDGEQFECVHQQNTMRMIYKICIARCPIKFSSK